MKKTFSFLLILLGLNLIAQKNSTTTFYTIDFKDPKSVVNAVFYGAKERNLDVLRGICDPLNKNDVDTKNICTIIENQEIATTKEQKNAAQENTNSFILKFETGKITGDVTFRKNEDGSEYADVPVWLNTEIGQGRNDVVIVLIKRFGNWYLYDM